MRTLSMLGLGLAAFAAVFLPGERLQRDTAGLVWRQRGRMTTDVGRIHCRLDELLEARGMTPTRLSELVGVSIVNLSVRKNDRARARFSPLTAICEALDCQVGELLVAAPA